MWRVRGGLYASRLVETLSDLGVVLSILSVWLFGFQFSTCYVGAVLFKTLGLSGRAQRRTSSGGLFQKIIHLLQHLYTCRAT